MSKRMLIGVSILFITLFSAGMIARAIGERTPNPVRALGFDMCDGAPCMLGIIPGVTTWADALAILTERQIPYTEAGNENFRRFEAAFYYEPTDAIGFYIELTRPVNTQIVSSLTVHNAVNREYMPLPTAIGIGDIFRLYGFPCGVGVNNDNVLPMGSANVHMKRLSRQRISTDHAVYNIQLGRSFGSNCFRAIKWRGFADGNLYNAMINYYYRSRAN